MKKHGNKIWEKKLQMSLEEFFWASFSPRRGGCETEKREKLWAHRTQTLLRKRALGTFPTSGHDVEGLIPRRNAELKLNQLSEG